MVIGCKQARDTGGRTICLSRVMPAANTTEAADPGNLARYSKMLETSAFCQCTPQYPSNIMLVAGIQYSVTFS